MKAFLKITTVILVLAFVLTGCSRKKNTFVSRNYHALTAKDNALYNGYLALDEGREALARSYNDNYWDILPIERLEIFEEITLPGQSKNESFSRAEEKAAKAIQKHSMNIDAKEYNPQMDEAYLLLGKARYFDQRFVPALAAFNNILNKYPTSDKINQVKIWKAKANIRLENNELAIKNLKRLIEQEELNPQDFADATSMLAQAYLNIKSPDSAVSQIGLAAEATKNSDEKGRFRFIQGQLYNSLGQKDSANYAFDKVIELNRRTPRVYLVSAQLAKVNNFDFDNGNKLELYEYLAELAENRENRPFLDKIYYQTAVTYLADGSDSIAVAYYNKALRTPTQDKLLRAHSYETLGNLNFDKSEYKIAGAYYDSTMNNLVINTKPYRIIQKKRVNLDEVIYYETIAQSNDSILDLVAMSDVERENYFGAYVEKLREEKQKALEEQEKKERNEGFTTADNNQAFGKGRSNNSRIAGGLPGRDKEASSFYFYNPTTVAYGKNEFTKNWGDRALEDNWRWANKARSSIKAVQANDSIASGTEDEMLDLQYYISRIPSEEKEIDSIIKVRNEAYYQLAIIYKEKFKEYELSKDKLKALLASNPEEKYIVPAKYNLYRDYEALGENSEAEIVKNDIISNYPETRYAQILKNPELASSDDLETPENVYAKLYQQFENQEYQLVIDQCEDYLTQFDGDPLIPKFELLKATASGRLYGLDAYSKGINYVALTYPNTEEGKQATQISNEVIPRIADASFVQDSLVGNFKIIFRFKFDEDKQIQELKKQIDEIIKDPNYYDTSTSVDVYDPNNKLLILHGIITKSRVYGLIERLEKNTKKKVKTPYFVISSENYRIVQIHKNLEAYLNRDTN